VRVWANGMRTFFERASLAVVHGPTVSQHFVSVPKLVRVDVGYTRGVAFRYEALRIRENS
jgi:hypothetical protein